MIRCSFPGCTAKSEQPFTDGWSDCDWDHPELPNGFYCKRCGDAIETVLDEGGFEDPENDLENDGFKDPKNVH